MTVLIMHRVSRFILLALLGLGLLTQCMSSNGYISGFDDRRITSSIVSKLIQDLSINNLDISVYTDEGEVFLLGRVDRFAQRISAEEHARGVEQVWSVINHLKTGQISDPKFINHDSQIKSRLLKEIIKAGEIPYLNLDIISLENEVYLIGRVDDDATRNALLKICQNTPNIKKIHNYLKAGTKKQF